MSTPRSKHVLTLDPDSIFPYLILHEDHWDDYHHKTMYDCFLFQEKGKDPIELGAVKILDKRQQYTDLPNKFFSLDENFCSLGQSVKYYEALHKLEKKLSEKVLTSLNDVVFNPKIAIDFNELEGFKISLLRFSEAEKAYKEGKYYLKGKVKDNEFEFKFTCQLDGATEEHDIAFNFKPIALLPHRINALIGKNGTGKTKVLSHIANAMSGIDRRTGAFEPERPTFSRVITIAYSAFDNFKRPDKDVDDNDKTFSYVYCGLRSKEGIMNIEDSERLAASLQKINKLERRDYWVEILQETIELKTLLQILKTPDKEEVTSLELSSGQNIILSVITDVLVNIQKESLILFDEPEMHLHPNLVSSLMRSFYKLLDQFNSYAIIATHSPLIIQEIPSKFVRVLDRDGTTPIVRDLGVESFGENLSSITLDVFQTDKELSNYQEYLIRLVENKATYQEVLDVFDNQLSLNTKIFLKGLYKEESEE